METKNTKNVRDTSESRTQRKDQAQNTREQNRQSTKGKGERQEPLKIGEGRWPEFKTEMRKQFPDIQDSDLPRNRELNDEFFDGIEKKYGHSRSKLHDAASQFEG